MKNKNITSDARKGGEFVGESHSGKNGGMRAIVVDNGKQPILVEGQEVIINKKSVNSNKELIVKGKPKEILSTINQLEGNGVPIGDEEAEILSKYKHGGKVPTEKQLYLGKEGGSNVGGKSSFEIARKLHKKGVNSEFIRKRTGWFLNKFDNLWRYEISDRDAKINKELLNQTTEYLLSNKKYDKAFFKLHKFYTNESLFKAYPSIKNILVNFIWDENSSVIAYVITSSNPDVNFIQLKINLYELRQSSKKRKSDYGTDFKSAITHELQHVIQIREGMGGGSSFARQFEKLSEKYKSGLLTRNGKKIRPNNGNDAENIRSVKNKAVINYKNSSGEIESRDVQNRIDLSLDERKIAIPYSSIEFKDKDVIVDLERPIKFNDGGKIGSNKNSNNEKGISNSRGGFNGFVKSKRAESLPFRKTITHELQHAIQVNEGLSKGGNFNDELDRLKHESGRLQDITEREQRLIASKRTRNKAGEIEAMSSDARLDFDKLKRSLKKPYSEISIDKEYFSSELENKIEFKVGGKIPDFSKMSKSEIKEFYDSPEGKKLDAETYKEWSNLVNMSKSELDKFYNSELGKKAGLSKTEANKQGISSGRESAKWILKMKDVPYTKWTPDMWRWAKKQISFIKRMSGAKGDLRDKNNKPTRKLLALKIWGNNPEKFNGGGEITKRALSVETSDLTDLVRKYFIKGGRMNISSAMQELFGDKKGKSTFSEYRKRIGLHKKDAPKISLLAHKLWEEHRDMLGEDIQDDDWRDAIEEVLISEHGKRAMIDTLISKSDESVMSDEEQYWISKHNPLEDEDNFDNYMTEDELQQMLVDVNNFEKEMEKGTVNKNTSIKELIEALEILEETELVEALMLLDDDVETFEGGGELTNPILKNGYVSIQNIKGKELCFITYNSGGQENLTVNDTINTIEASNVLREMKDLCTNSSRQLIYEHVTNSNRIETKEELDYYKNMPWVIILDRDKVEFNKTFAKGGELTGSTSMFFEPSDSDEDEEKRIMENQFGKNI